MDLSMTKEERIISVNIAIDNTKEQIEYLLNNAPTEYYGFNVDRWERRFNKRTETLRNLEKKLIQLKGE